MGWVGLGFQLKNLQFGDMDWVELVCIFSYKICGFGNGLGWVELGF